MTKVFRDTFLEEVRIRRINEPVNGVEAGLSESPWADSDAATMIACLHGSLQWRFYWPGISSHVEQKFLA
jgi:hypothetical protein